MAASRITAEMQWAAGGRPTATAAALPAAPPTAGAAAAGAFLNVMPYLRQAAVAV